MAKKTTPAATVIDTPMNEVALLEDVQARSQLAEMEQQRQDRLADLATKLGYKGSLGGDALMDGARAAKQRVGMAIMEFGAYLLLLKAGCEHGQFGRVLIELEIVPNTARTYMALTRRFSKHSSTGVLESLGFGKAAELLGLDDEQVDELAEVGSTGELALDDVARMSLKELRAAVRKERLVKDRLKMVNDELNTELALKKNLVVAATDWPEAFKVLMNQAQFASKNIKIQIGSLVAISQEALKPEAASEDDEASLTRAREVLAEELLTMHRSCAKLLEQAGMLFNNTLCSFASEGLYK